MENNIVDDILDKAFRRAKENAKSISNVKNKIIKVRKREIVRLETVKNIVLSELDKLLLRIPKEYSLSKYYKELLDIVFGLKKIRKSVIRIKFIKKFISELFFKYKNSIKITKDVKKMKELRKEFYGRVASFLKRNKEYINFLFEVYRYYQKLPKFKAYPTVIIAGLPNVGKSTLLKKLTGSEPKIEPYPFTTKEIMLGYINIPYFSIQVVDTPGLLDRPFDEMNVIEKKAILAIRHLANLIIYVIDITETCGFSIKEQINLLNQIKKEFNIDIWIYFSKSDLFSEDDYKKVKELGEKLNLKYFLDSEELKKELIEYVKSKKELYL